MNEHRPDFLTLVRAPFLSSILSPLIAGTLLAVAVTHTFYWLNFIIILIMGVGLHIATNVYNDIYDTLQGTDKINMNRNPFSGGSGTLVNYPDYIPVIYRIARLGVAVALIATIALTFLIDKALWIYLWSLFLFSAILSKYYTAAPLKLASRGWGEIFVWLAFGPMAVFVAAVGQNTGIRDIIVIAMPLTGFSTLSILLIGQMIDRDADHATGKWGVAVRFGNKVTAVIYLCVQILLCINIILASWFVPGNGWPVLFGLLPYALYLPAIWNILRKHPSEPEWLIRAAQKNVQIHLLFSLLLNIGLGITLVL